MKALLYTVYIKCNLTLSQHNTRIMCSVQEESSIEHQGSRSAWPQTIPSIQYIFEHIDKRGPLEFKQW